MVSEKILLLPTMVQTLSGVFIVVPNSPMVSVEGGRAEQDRERALVGSYDCALGRISRIRMPRGVSQF